MRRVKILSLGNSGVGKTSFIRRFCDEAPSLDFSSTIGVDFKIRTIIVNGEPVTLEIWDTAGQERFRVIVDSFYRKADAAFVMYDIGDRSSLESVSYWIGMCRQNCHRDMPIIIVANKSDLLKTRTMEVTLAITLGRELASAEGVPFMTASAMEGDNVKSTVIELAHSALKKRVVTREVTDVQEISDESTGILAFCRCQ